MTQVEIETRSGTNLIVGASCSLSCHMKKMHTSITYILLLVQTRPVPQHHGADLKRLEEGIPIFDAYLQQEVLVVAPVMAFLCDNPRYSELLGHAGGRARKYCRMCMVCVTCSVFYCT